MVTPKTERARWLSLAPEPAGQETAAARPANRSPVPGDVAARDWGPVLAEFDRWLGPRRLAARSRSTYLQRVGRFCAFVQARAAAGDGPPLVEVLVDRHALSYAARDWRRQLLTVDKAAVSTVNVSLAALAALGESRGLGPLEVDRVDQARRAPAALSQPQARDLLRAAQRAGVRDHALVALLHATGLRISEAAALDVDDVPTTARTGQVLVRAGKGAKPRTVPLTGSALAAVRDWLSVDEHLVGRRAALPSAAGEPALWIGQRGRASVRQLQRTLERLGQQAGLIGFSAHTLRHTAATAWLRGGIDVVTVAELFFFYDMETTVIYTRPTQRDLAAAVAAVELDY